MLYVNVTATLEADVPTGATEQEINEALEITSLSADDPIDMLSHDPDKFFGRTTKVGWLLGLRVEPCLSSGD